MATVELISGHLVRMELDTFSRKIKITQKDPDNPDKGPQTIVTIDTYTLLKSVSNLISTLISFEAARSERLATTHTDGEYIWTASDDKSEHCSSCNSIRKTYCQYIDRDYIVACTHCQRIMRRGSSLRDVVEK